MSGQNRSSVLGHSEHSMFCDIIKRGNSRSISHILVVDTQNMGLPLYDQKITSGDFLSCFVEMPGKMEN